jgi:hypothetical protein
MAVSTHYIENTSVFAFRCKLARPASRTSREPKVRGIPDRDAIAIRRVNAFADFDFGLGNKRIRVLLARKSFHVELAGLAGVVAKPSLALFADRCFPNAFSDGHCVTLCFTHRTRHWI